MSSVNNNFRLILPGIEKHIQIAANAEDILDYKKFQEVVIESILIHMPIRKEEIIKIELPHIKSPLHLRCPTSDLYTFWQLFINNEYGFPIRDKPNLIIDGGANVGYAAVFFANRFPEAKIIAIEPEQTNFELLKENTIDYQNILLRNSGIWNKNTYLKIHDLGVRKDAFMVEEVDREEQGSFKAVTVGEVLRESGYDEIDILKLDIEGAEKEVFSDNYEEWLGRVNILIIELHDRMKEGCSEAFFSAIKKYKFNITFKGENIILIKPAIAPRFKIDFTCRLADGTIWTTSSGGEPLIFALGDAQIFPDLEQVIMMMDPGNSKTVTIPADSAFGPYHADKMYVVSREQLPKDVLPEIGQQFQINLPDGLTNTSRVTQVSDNRITLDANHPLAGKDLYFDIKLIEIS
jgi:FkbM family methyltransferase